MGVISISDTRMGIGTPENFAWTFSTILLVEPVPFFAQAFLSPVPSQAESHINSGGCLVEAVEDFYS